MAPPPAPALIPPAAAVEQDPPLHLGALGRVGDGGNVLHDVLAGLRLACPALAWQGGQGLGEGSPPKGAPHAAPPPRQTAAVHLPEMTMQVSLARRFMAL